MNYNVVIIGAGVVGAAIARELSRYQLKIAVLEKESDVAMGASKANSGICHAGFSESPGTLKAYYNVRGQKLFDSLATELDFSFERCGSLVLSFDEEGNEKLQTLKLQGEENGLEGLQILTDAEVKILEPNINETVLSALFAPMGGILSPYGMTVAYAENAAMNGVDFYFESRVIKIKKLTGDFTIQTQNHLQFQASILINAAGVFSDEINNMLSSQKITIEPRLGEYVLLDKSEFHLVKRTLFQLPTILGKGALVTPTTSSNILIGPSTIPVEDKKCVSVTTSGMEYILQKASLSLKNIDSAKIITSYAGLRAHPTTGDFIIGWSKDVEGMMNVAGIESPGLTAAPAIAIDVSKWVAKKTKAPLNKNFSPYRKGISAFAALSNEERRNLIRKNDNYGQIICRCELVTRGEIQEALCSPLKRYDIDALKRRTRLGMGRCQGGFCHMKIVEIIAEEMGIELTEVTKNSGDSTIFIEKNKTSL